MYSKETINTLFREYVSSQDDRFLSRLIEELDDMTNIILRTRWASFIQYHDDIGQEVRLRLWRNLRRRKASLGEERYAKNPTAYLYFLIRTYTARAFKSVQGKCPVYMLSLDDILSQRSGSAY